MFLKKSDNGLYVSIKCNKSVPRKDNFLFSSCHQNENGEDKKKSARDFCFIFWSSWGTRMSSQIISKKVFSVKFLAW